MEEIQVLGMIMIGIIQNCLPKIMVSALSHKLGTQSNTIFMKCS